MIINNKEYINPEINFNNICILERMGVSLLNQNSSIFDLLRGYISLAMNNDMNKAGDEIDKHILNGGNLNELINSMNEAINESGFFQALKKGVS